MNSTEETIKDILVQLLSVEPDMVYAEAQLREDLRADSLDLVELVSILSARYKVRVHDQSVRHIKTFGQLVDYIQTNSILDRQ